MPPSLFPVILSGGAGSRLWPLSTKPRPKQHHALAGDDTMLAETIKRVENVDGVALQPAMVIGSTDHAAYSRETLERLGQGSGVVVSEPKGQNTAPAAALACLLAVERDPEALVLLLPSDHHIGNTPAFLAAIATGAAHAAQGSLVAFGIRPSRPETGYGYIARGEPVGDAFRIERFVEKPLAPEAEAMVSAGSFDWNAGIFLFHAATFLSELARLRPAMMDAVAASLDAAQRSAVGDVVPDPVLWDKVPSDSIDYAVMQETDVGRVVPVDMDWSDLGSFQTLWEMSAKDEAGNALCGDVMLEAASGNYVRAEGGRLIALVGCEDIVVVDTGKAVLVMPRSKAQAVKKIVTRLKEEGRTEDL